MSFTSSIFPFFLIAFYLILALWGPKNRWIWLIISSCIFYMAFIPGYILILFLLIGIDFYAGILIEKHEGKKRKLYLILSILANIILLANFKYLNFIIDNTNLLLSNIGLHSIEWKFPWALPIGLSFHTFQSMAYTIEVYFGRQKAERHLGIYALYVLFFPQMVAGPIERPQNLLNKFHWDIQITPSQLAEGMKLAAWGFFKKVVIADRLSEYVNSVYSSNTNENSWAILISAYFFAIQIYCDFSGYTDIARGIAKTMGIDLMVNFDRPYASQNPSEFWKRWHISLSTWFRDYVFIPLGGNRRSEIRILLNFMIVFLISGLWHGAAWNFIIWGGLHGAFLSAHWLFFRKPKGDQSRPSPIRKAINIAFTFNLITLSLIFFRATSVQQAFEMIWSIIRFDSLSHLLATLNVFEVRLGILLILVLEFLQWAMHTGKLKSWYERQVTPVRWGVWYALVACVFIFGRFGNEQFIYFQF